MIKTIGGKFIPDIRLIGRKYNRLTILEDLGNKLDRNHRVQCQCDCGKITNPQLGSLRDGSTKSCGCLQKEITSLHAKSMSGEKHPNWKGGRFIHEGGYIRMKCAGHPRSSGGYVLEHIVVMEKKIDRSLLPGETVHHINGIKGDNRPENLELWDQNHCAGQRHIEKMAFHVQELVSKTTDDELQIVHSAIQKRMIDRGFL